MIEKTGIAMMRATGAAVRKASSPSTGATLRDRLGSLAQVIMLAVLALAFSLACSAAASAQQTTGGVRGIVTDPAGAVVPGAKVTISSQKLNYKAEAATTTGGEYEFRDVLPGEYQITIEAANFKTLALTDVRVQLNQTTDVPAQLQIGVASETVNVSAGGAELVETTTTQLSKSFNERQVVELAQTNVGGAFGGGVNNLALLAPNVASSGGVGVGSGGSIGGQRPRNNNFMVDGVDNNDKSVTGPQTYVSPENVAEFSLIQNQFSAEYGRSNGGQFITITKSGTNDFHGSFYGFFRNRYLLALDTLQKIAGVVREQNVPGREFMPRYDFFRGGANIGGPIYLPRFGEGSPSVHSGKDKLFFYAAYERLQQGLAAAPGGITTPTAQGFTILNSIPGLSATNRAIFNLYVPVAPANDAGHVTVNGVNIPIGNVTFPSPNWLKQNNVVTNFDYNQSTKTTHRWRFNLNNNVRIDAVANLPVFFVVAPIKQRLFSYSNFHTFTSNLSNEARLAFRRSETRTPVGPQTYPGLDAFPNVILNDLGINIGPNGNAPQITIENNYQVVDNVTYLWGNHSLKFGGDFRNIISPQRFVQRERGEYDYSTADLFLRDLSPDIGGQRNVGASTYYGNQKVLYAFAQDDWRARPNVTLNLGVGYSYQEVPLGARLQKLNALSSVPGLIEFREPQAQTRNFAPRLGIVYAPNFTQGLFGRVFGSNGESSIRAGFSMAYDYVFDNLYILSSPPQAQQTVNVPDLTVQTPNFLANGGIRNIPAAAGTNPVAARLATSAFVVDQEVPYSLTWTLSFQRQFRTNWSVEMRYIGTRGIHLFTQSRINRQGKVSPQLAGLPTFLSSPTQAQLDALTLNLATINARTSFVPAFEAAGFNGNNIVTFLPNGNSTYHGASVQLIRRFADGFSGTAAYTWSHLIDDSTAEVNSTALTPRRPEEFIDMRRERADSALDRRHRFVFSGIYEVPLWRSSSNKFLRVVLGGFNFAGTLTLESGEKATVLSGTDSNINGDAAADRTIRNPLGARDTGSVVTPLLRTCTAFNANGTCSQSAASRTVGYLAANPSAEYIQAGPGAVSNSARNTLQLPGINNVDFSVFKNFRFGESRRIQLRADFFNLFNHAQFVPGSVNDISPIPTAGVNNLNTVGRAEFNRPDLVFIHNARLVQMALRFDF